MYWDTNQQESFGNLGQPKLLGELGQPDGETVLFLQFCQLQLVKKKGDVIPSSIRLQHAPQRISDGVDFLHSCVEST